MHRAKLLLLAMLLLATVTLLAEQYHVVGEVFTSTTCGYCPDARAGLAGLSANQPELFIPVMWESNQHTSPSYSARASMYGVSGIPHAQFCGTDDVVGGGTNMLPYYTNTFNANVNYDSPIAMTVAFGEIGDGDYVLSANCEVVADLPTTQNKVVFLITKYWSDEYFCTVARYAYEDFTLTGVGDTGTFTHTFDGDTTWNIADLRAVIMVQDWGGSVGDKQILQARMTENTTLTAMYSASVTSGPAQLGVQFHDMSIPSADIVGWAWDFDGDGEVDSNEQSPYYLYETPGQYDVSLTVTDVNNETANTTMPDYITVTDGSAVYGSVSGMWVEEFSPYHIISDMQVPAGCQLSIEPGVQVVLANEAKVEVAGSINAVGGDDMVYFSGGANRNEWSGLEIRFTDGASNFTKCWFADAIATAMFIEESEVLIKDCVFTNNTNMARAGALHVVVGNDVTVEGNYFYGNSSDNNAGAIGVENSIITLTGNLIVNNTGGFASAVGGKQSSEVTLVNNTIANNLNTGSTHGDVAMFQSDAVLVNTIVRSQNSSPIYTFTAGMDVTYCNVSGGFSGTGNIDENPMFESPTEGDGVEYMNEDATWFLMSDSGCIDAGDPSYLYYDVEDPENTGSALYPAMGTITADMGCYGGPTPCFWAPGTPVGGEEIPEVTQYAVTSYPNPFNPTTTLALSIPDDATNLPVSLTVYNVRGQRIATLLNNEVPQSRTFTWNGVDDSGSSVASGVYFARLEVAGQSVTHKMALLK